MADLPGFISYSTRDKHVAAEVREALSHLGVDCFLAHDDLRVSEEWKKRIEQELRRCSVFVALLSKRFRASAWAPQEVGFAVARRGVLVIPISLDGVDPFGFIGHLQAERAPAPISHSFFLPPLVKKFPHHVLPRLIESLSGARSFRRAEELMEPLVPLFDAFDQSEIVAFVEACIGNDQIWEAARCKAEYIPEFIEAHRTRIPEKRLRVLKYHIEERRLYPGDNAT